MRLGRFLLALLTLVVPASSMLAERAGCSISGPYNHCSINCRTAIAEYPRCTCDDNGWVHCSCVARYSTSSGVDLIAWVRDNYTPLAPEHVALLEGMGSTGHLAASALQAALAATASQNFTAYESSVLQYNSALELLTPAQRQVVDDFVSTIE